MKKNYTQKKIRLLGLSVFFMMGAIFLTGCEESVMNPGAFNPDIPVVVTKFEPATGGAMERVLIYGSNFGNDKSNVQVYFNGMKGVVIGASDGVLYAVVPARAGTGPITVKVGNDQSDGQITESTENFAYVYKSQVRSMAGFRDQDLNTNDVDGPIKNAQFTWPTWLTFDENKNLYLVEEGVALRFIDKDFTEVTTKFRAGGGIRRLRTASFSPDFQTLYLANDDDSDVNAISNISTKASSGFTVWNTLSFSRQCNGSAAHPITGELFFNSYGNGDCYKWDLTIPGKDKRKVMFNIGFNNAEYNIQFAPSGNYAYLVSINGCVIYRSEYDWTTNELKSPTVLAGQLWQGGYNNGSGSNARFTGPYQGAFDEFENFYVCDGGDRGGRNHCIRKVTPDGLVSLFAGRPGQWGLADGAILEATFDWPRGIVYDKDTKIFYVAEWWNAKIRAIVVE